MKHSVTLMLLAVLIMGGCSKKNSDYNTLENMPTSDQLKLVESRLQNNEPITASFFGRLSFTVQKLTYTKLNAENKLSLWNEKLAVEMQNETDPQKKVYLEKLHVFIKKMFANKLSNNELLSQAKLLEAEGFVTLGKMKLIELAKSPGIIVSDASFSRTVTVNYVIPPTGTCECAVASDYCPSGKSCISPTKGCSGGDTACGFLLLYTCDGTCISIPA